MELQFVVDGVAYQPRSLARLPACFRRRCATLTSFVPFRRLRACSASTCVRNMPLRVYFCLCTQTVDDCAANKDTVSRLGGRNPALVIVARTGI